MVCAAVPNWTKHIACEKCCVELQTDSEWNSASVYQESRAAEWKTICPPLYQETKPDRIPTPSQAAFMAATHRPLVNRGLLLCGPSGTGKTRAAFEILKQWHLSGRGVTIFTANEFAVECAAQCAAGGESFSRWLNKVKRTGVLFIDDLGKRTMTETAEAQLFDVLDYRLTRLLPTIITAESNLSTGVLSPARADAITTRIANGFDPIDFPK